MNILFHHDTETDIYLPINQLANGKICPYFILEGPIFKQGAAYVKILNDLNDCKESILYLNGIKARAEIPQIAKSSLLFASIVKYAKCFNSGEGRGTSLNERDVFKGTMLKYKTFHKKTMELRNKYLAHAGDSGHERGSMVLILNPDLDNKKIVTLQYGGINLKDDDSNIDNYLSLFSIVIEYISKRIEVNKKSMHIAIAQMEIEKVYSKSKMPNLSSSHPLPAKSVN